MGAETAEVIDNKEQPNDAIIGAKAKVQKITEFDVKKTRAGRQQKALVEAGDHNAGTEVLLVHPKAKRAAKQQVVVEVISPVEDDEIVVVAVGAKTTEVTVNDEHQKGGKDDAIGPKEKDEKTTEPAVKEKSTAKNKKASGKSATVVETVTKSNKNAAFPKTEVKQVQVDGKKVQLITRAGRQQPAVEVVALVEGGDHNAREEVLLVEFEKKDIQPKVKRTEKQQVAVEMIASVEAGDRNAEEAFAAKRQAVESIASSEAGDHKEAGMEDVEKNFEPKTKRTAKLKAIELMKSDKRGDKENDETQKTVAAKPSVKTKRVAVKPNTVAAETDTAKKGAAKPKRAAKAAI